MRLTVRILMRSNDVGLRAVNQVTQAISTSLADGL
jgi:hypothetical protein